MADGNTQLDANEDTCYIEDGNALKFKEKSKVAPRGNSSFVSATFLF